mmetsp:Transcript_111711/g.303242  ORF Transcript_111711/g.303242 Transcript_111711/m.303242 type:complete len:364 (+) Transcript_111711:90-1181(+)
MVGTFPPTPATETEAEAPLSNCLLLQLSGILGGKAGVQAALAIASLRQELESCGDIAQVEHCPGRGPDGTAMLVTFWDRRSAGSAKEAFGSACSYEPQADSCTATLTRDSLAHLKGCEVSKTTELGDDLLEVEFFDSRTAAAAIAMSATCSTLASLTNVGSGCDLASVETASDSDQESSASEGRCGLAPAAVDAQASELASGAASLRPKFVRGEDGLGLSQLSWGALESRREWRTELRLRGLPACLCERGALQEAVVQLGLRDAVRSVQVPDASKSKAGWAVLRAKSVADVPRIAKAFHGRVFRGSRMPVAVSFSDGSGLSGGSRCRPTAPAGKLAEPLWVSCAAASAEEELSFPPGLSLPVC